jgi:hypothetical protein
MFNWKILGFPLNISRDVLHSPILVPCMLLQKPSNFTKIVNSSIFGFKIIQLSQFLKGFNNNLCVLSRVSLMVDVLLQDRSISNPLLDGLYFVYPMLSLVEFFIHTSL